MGSPRQHARRKPGERSDLARRVWNRKQAGVSDQDLGTEFGLAKRTIRALVFEGKRLAGHTGRILPEKLREPRRWNQPATLQLKGSPAGDVMALAQLEADRTRDEATHELQCLMVGRWETTDVGNAETCARLKERMKRRIKRREWLDGLSRGQPEGRSRFTHVRVVERVPR